MRNKNRKLIGCAAGIMIGVVGLILQYMASYEAHKAQDMREEQTAVTAEDAENAEAEEREAGKTDAASETETDDVINAVMEGYEPDLDVESQNYTDGYVTPEIYFSAPEQFYDNLFTIAGYEKVAAELEMYLKENGYDVSGEMQVLEDSIATDENSSSFDAVSAEAPEISIHTVYDKETGMFAFSFVQEQ